MKLVDLTGQTFGRLTVVSRAENSNGGKARWLCKCECGNDCIVHASALRSGNTKSCGCLRAEISHDRVVTHGMSRTSLFHVWRAMKDRCLNPNNRSYKNYGGKGVRVCDEWLDSTTFFDWARSSGYEDGLTIERIDVNGDYCPENCKWIPFAEQARNKTNNLMIEIDGVSKCLAQWCDEYDMSYFMVSQRIRKLGWEPKKALTTPPRKTKARKQVKNG